MSPDRLDGLDLSLALGIEEVFHLLHSSLLTPVCDKGLDQIEILACSGEEPICPFHRNS